MKDSIEAAAFQYMYITRQRTSGIEESFFKAIIYPEGVTDPALRKITHAFIHLWKQAQHCEISSETYKGMRHIFNQAWIECNPDIQEKWEL